MQITINTLESGPDQLTALIALCASLGGRLPSVHTETVRLTVDKGEVLDTLREAVAEVREDLPESERLIEQAAAAVDPRPAGHFPDEQTVDANGLPWDARIHSESKALNADKTWRKRRGVDEATFASVMAELTAGNVPNGQPGTPAAAISEASIDGAATSTANAAIDDTPAPPVPNVPSAPTEDVPPAPEPAASAPVATDTPPPPAAFDGFPAFVSSVSKHNKNYAELNELAGMVGVAAFKDMKDHADKWDTFYAMLG